MTESDDANRRHVALLKHHFVAGVKAQAGIDF
jgi:hypothetical protein